LAKYTTLELEN